METQSIVSSDFKIIYVSGYGGLEGSSPNDVKDSLWLFTSYLRDISEREREEQSSRDLYVVNSSKVPLSADEGDISDLQEMLLAMPLTEDKISRVIIAHSHGAKIVFEGLQENNLKRKGIDGDKIAKIRRHLAVFILGGIQEVPHHFARVVRNLDLPDDDVARYGKLLLGENPINDEIKDIAWAAVREAVVVSPKITMLAGSVASAGISASASSSGSSFESHYITAYVKSKQTMNEVLKALGLLR